MFHLIPRLASGCATSTVGGTNHKRSTGTSDRRAAQPRPAELLLGRSISLEGHGEVWVLAGGAQEKSQPGTLSAAGLNLRHCQA